MKPYLILLLPPLFWSGNFVVGRAIASEIDPISLSFWRWMLALLFILPFIIMPIKKQWPIIKQNLPMICLLSFLGVTAFNTLAYLGLQGTTATNGTLLNSFIPIFILIISGIFFSEQVSKLQVIGVLVSLVGVFIILSKLDVSIIKALSFNSGDLWILLAALDWALYSIFLKLYRPKGLTGIAFLGITMIIGVLTLLPLYLINPLNEAPIVLNQNTILSLSYVSIFPSILAYLAWNYGISKVGAGIGGQFIHLMPLFGALMAVAFLGETLELHHLLGACAIATGLWLSVKRAV